MLAHQGGWDDLLLPALLVLGLIAYPMLRDRRRGQPVAERVRPVQGCAYCGGRIGPDDARCLRCGFRTPHASHLARRRAERRRTDRPLFKPAKRSCPTCGRVNPVDATWCPQCLREIHPWEG